ELVAAVRGMLRDDLLPELTGGSAFRVRVAINALGMVERELSGAAGRAGGAAVRLGFADDTALSHAIRAGEVTDDARLRALLLDDVAARLRVAAPAYPD